MDRGKKVMVEPPWRSERMRGRDVRVQDVDPSARAVFRQTRATGLPGPACLSTVAAVSVCAPKIILPSCISIGHIRKNGTTHMGFQAPLQEKRGLRLGNED